MRLRNLPLRQHDLILQVDEADRLRVVSHRPGASCWAGVSVGPRTTDWRRIPNPLNSVPFRGWRIRGESE